VCLHGLFYLSSDLLINFGLVIQFHLEWYILLKLKFCSGFFTELRNVNFSLESLQWTVTFVVRGGGVFNSSQAKSSSS